MIISIALRALTGSFETDTKRAARNSEREFKKIEESARKMGVAVGAAFSAAALAGAALVRQAINTADELSKTAQRIGITTEELSRLKFAAELSDVSLQELQGALARLTRNQAEAARGNEAAIEIFERYGVAVTDINGQMRDTESVLQDFARVFSDLPDGPEKTAAALEVFGRSGQSLIPLLNQGAEGLAELGREAENLGLVVSTQTGRAAEEFNDTITRLGSQVEGLGLQLAEQLLPDLQELADRFVSVNRDGALTDQIATGIRATFDGLAVSATTVTAAVGSIIGRILELTAVLVEFQASTPAAYFADFVGLIDREGIASGARELGRTGADISGRSDSTLGDVFSGSRSARIDFGRETNRLIAGLPTPEEFAESQRAAEGLAETITVVATAEQRAEAESTREREAATAARRAAADATRAQAEAERERQRIEELARSSLSSLIDLERELARETGGPVVEATLDYVEAMERVASLRADLLESGALTEEQSLRLAAAEEAYAEKLRGTIAEQERQKQAGRTILNEKQIREEVDQASEYANEAARNIQGIISNGLTNGFKGGFKGLLDEFGRVITQILAEIAAARIAESIFGGGGGGKGQKGGGGGWGDIIGSLFGAFAGGRANGGSVLPGRFYRVNERGPEMFSVGGSDYLMAGSGGGMVKSNRSSTVNQTINVSGRIDRRTASQLASETARRQRVSTSRFG